MSKDLKLFDITNISDIPTFSSKERPDYKISTRRVLQMIEEVNDFLTPEEIRVGYYRKYHLESDFISLSIEQVKYILNILNYQQDFIIKNKSYKINTEKRHKLNYKLILKLFEDCDLTTNDAYLKYKAENNVKNLPRSSFINAIKYLTKRNCLKPLDKKFKPTYTLITSDNLNIKLENKVNEKELKDLINNKEYSFDDTCKELGTTRAKLIGTLKRQGLSWDNRKKRQIFDTKTGKTWKSLSDCAKELGVSRQYINQSIKRNSVVKGLYLEYKDV